MVLYYGNYRQTRLFSSHSSSLYMLILSICNECNDFIVSLILVSIHVLIHVSVGYTLSQLGKLAVSNCCKCL